MFFDHYERFRDTSEVAPDRGRLNLRYEAIFAANQEIFEGARVLDLACNDGRWSFAALRTGAAHVTGIEARPELVDNANETFAHYGEDPSNYRFVCDDVLTALRDGKFDVDVVLNLGYIYHTTRHTELLSYLRALDPKYMIVDSHVIPRMQKPYMELRRERPHLQGTAVLDPFSHDERTLVGLPSVSALMLMLETYDFGIERAFDWSSLIAQHPEEPRVSDYANGGRVTLRCRSGISTPEAVREAALASGQRRQAPEQSRPGPAAPAPSAANESAAVSDRGGWRHLLNRGLAQTTGYELRRASR